MKKNSVAKLLVLIPSCIVLASCGKKEVPAADLFYSYSSENLMSDWNYLEKAELNDPEPYLKRDKTLRFHLMKGENEGAQLMIHANKYINSFYFEAPDVSNGSKTISKDNFSISVAWYQGVYGSVEYDSFGGMYPDALIPQNEYKIRRKDQIEKGNNQALYVNFLSTEDMDAGFYKGTGKLYLNGKATEIPFEVTIYDALMPVEKHQSTNYLIWYDQIAVGEKRNSTKTGIDKQYYDFLVSKRINPDGLPDKYESTPELFAESFYEYVVKNPKVNDYRFPAQGSNFNKQTVRNYLNELIRKNIEVREDTTLTVEERNVNFFDKLYFYVDDEPSYADFAKVKGHDKDIFDLKNELSYKLDEYPDLKASFMAMENVVTREFTKELVATNDTGGIQTWCPQFDNFETPEQRKLYRDRQLNTDGDERDGGENVWWYGCIQPASPYPSYHLDAKVITSRIVKYMAFDYEIEGEIFWSINYFSKKLAGSAGTVSRDIWNDPMTWDACAGDGCLCYPGYDYGIFGPITTLRLENALASNEEYEYLWLIDQKVNEFNANHSASLKTRDLLSSYFTKLFDGMKPTLDVETFENTRIELLKVVESLNKNLDAGISALISK